MALDDHGRGVLAARGAWAADDEVAYRVLLVGETALVGETSQPLQHPTMKSDNKGGGALSACVFRSVRVVC